MMPNTNRIVPTSEEINFLKEKLSNIKNLNIIPPRSFVDPVIKKQPRSVRKKGVNNSFNVPLDRDLNLYDSSTRSVIVSNINHRSNIVNDNLLKSTNLEDFLGISDYAPSKTVRKDVIYKNTHESMSFRNKKPNEDSLKVSNSKNLNERDSKKQSYTHFNLDEDDKNKLTRQFSKNPTLTEILKDYTKVKSESILLKKNQVENEKHILNLEKENKFLKDLYNNLPVNKSSLKYFVINLLCNKLDFNDYDTKKFLYELFINENSKSKIDFVRFLDQRIDALELQNFHLITKIEKSNNSIKTYINELNEFCEVISDIRNVVNQVYESQSLTTEFLIIRDTLNNKMNYLMDQKEINFGVKERIEKDETKIQNMNLLLCKDKIVESKVNISNYGATNSKNSALNASTYSNNNNNKILELIDEKIEIYENLRNNMAQYEDNIIKEKDLEENNNFNLNTAENLMNENYLLKTKNIRLIKFLYSFMKNKEFDMTEESLYELDDLMNGNPNHVFPEDLFNIIKSQSIIIENILGGQI